jgi:lipoyl(octanoyl) transferase
MTFEVLSVKGLASFQSIYEMQLDLLSKRIRDEIPDTIILCEHTPVITRGRGLQFQKGREERAKPLLQIPAGTDYHEIERGGDLTWHGPGQLVIYPIVKLGGEGAIGKRVGQDVEKWVRFQENIWIEVLREFGVEGKTKEGGSGVWISSNELASNSSLEGFHIQQKVASVGIALRRWVNFHGVAVNIMNDLQPFHGFDPCGFHAEVMTRLKDFKAIPAEYFDLDWRNRWEKAFSNALHKLIA